MLTIKQLADYVGVTRRAVRHYHRIGLLSEPERDVSGYRSYTAQDVIDLQRIKVLADAGVPLARVRDLLSCGPEELAAAVKEIDDALAARIQDLRATRRRLTALATAEDPFMSPKIAAVVAEYKTMNISDETMRINRDGWLLIQVLYPRLIDPWLDWQLEVLADPAYREMCALTDQARGWDVDDPRIEQLARRSALWIRSTAPPQFEDWDDDRLAYRLLTTYDSGTTTPGWAHLNRRVQELVGESGGDAGDRTGTRERGT
jgi:DNA-binding transcriptional MerR regulator